MKRAEPEAIEIPGLDVAKAKRYSRTRLAVLLLSTLWTVARLRLVCVGPAGGAAERVDRRVCFRTGGSQRRHFSR